MQKSLAKNMVFKFILNISNIIIPLLVNSYVLRKFGDDTMGYINYSQSMYSFALIFATFGVYQYGLREISRVRDNKEEMSKVFSNLFIITFVTNIVTIIIYSIFLSVTYSGTIIYSVAMILGFNFVANIFYVEWVAEALENFDFITIKSIIVQCLYFVAIFIMVKNADDYREYVWLLAMSTFLNYIISFIYVKRKIKFNFKGLNIKHHIAPMFMVVILSNANVLYTQLDRLLLGAVGETNQVAYYTTAQGIMYIVNTLMLTVVHVTIPRLSNLLSNKDEKGYESLLDKISRMYLMFLFPAAVGLFVVGKECILIYGGAKFANAIPYMYVFAFYMITIGYENVLSNQIMYLKGQEKTQVKLVFSGGIINLAFKGLLILAGIFGGINAIITTVLANTALVVFQYVYIKRVMRLNISLFSFQKMKYLIISLMFIPITMILRNFVSGVISSFIIIIGVNVLIYFIVLIIIKDDMIMEGISMAKQKIFKK
ncbi:MAG: oligosaccharide flippase family protein [Clostridium sp.]